MPQNIRSVLNEIYYLVFIYLYADESDDIYYIVVSILLCFFSACTESLILYATCASDSK